MYPVRTNSRTFFVTVEPLAEARPELERTSPVAERTGQPWSRSHVYVPYGSAKQPESGRRAVVLGERILDDTNVGARRVAGNNSDSHSGRSARG